jgi:hypothetical protein
MTFQIRLGEATMATTARVLKPVVKRVEATVLLDRFFIVALLVYFV